MQESLERNGRMRANGSHASEPSLLKGLLFDDRGNRLSPSHAVKDSVRYRYYGSQALLQHDKPDAGAVTRLAAAEIERLVVHRISALMKDTAGLMDELGLEDTDPREQHRMIVAAKRFATGWPSLPSEDQRAFLQGVVRKITVATTEISIALSRPKLLGLLVGAHDGPQSDQGHTNGSHESDDLVLTITARLKRCGSELRYVALAGAQCDLPPRPSLALIKAIARAHAWKDKLLTGQASSIRALATEESLPERYVTRILHLAFLAPAIVEAILDGQQPADLDLERLRKGIPHAWQDQQHAFGLQSF